MTTLALAAGAAIGLAAVVRRARATRQPTRAICPICHVGHGWHDVDVHAPEAVS